MAQPTEHSADFSTVYQQHVTRVYRYLLARVGNAADAEDLTAQTFTAALERFDSFRGESHLATWLIGIARHKLADFYRQQRRAAQPLPMDAVQDVPGVERATADSALATLDREEIARLLGRLSPERAEAVALPFFAELSHREVAEALGKSEAAAKMLVHRGVQDLRRWLLDADQNQVLSKARPIWSMPTARATTWPSTSARARDAGCGGRRHRRARPRRTCYRRRCRTYRRRSQRQFARQLCHAAVGHLALPRIIDVTSCGPAPKPINHHA